MHSAMSLLWTPFGPSGTKLGVGRVFFCIPIYAFQDFQVFFLICTCGIVVLGEMPRKGRNEILGFPFKKQYLL